MKEFLKKYNLVLFAIAAVIVYAVYFYGYQDHQNASRYGFWLMFAGMVVNNITSKFDKRIEKECSEAYSQAIDDIRAMRGE